MPVAPVAPLSGPFPPPAFCHCGSFTPSRSIYQRQTCRWFRKAFRLSQQQVLGEGERREGNENAKMRETREKRWIWVRNLTFYVFRGAPWGSAGFRGLPRLPVALVGPMPGLFPPPLFHCWPPFAIRPIYRRPTCRWFRKVFHLSHHPVLGQGEGTEENAERERKCGKGAKIRWISVG